MRNSFFNTVNASGQVLIEYEQGAKSQQELVFSVYRFAFRPLAWFECEALLVEPMNQVSIKRCITNLYKAGKLTKTETMVKGIYGKPCHQYKLA